MPTPQTQETSQFTVLKVYTYPWGLGLYVKTLGEFRAEAAVLNEDLHGTPPQPGDRVELTWTLHSKEGPAGKSYFLAVTSYKLELRRRRTGNGQAVPGDGQVREGSGDAEQAPRQDSGVEPPPPADAQASDDQGSQPSGAQRRRKPRRGKQS